MKMKRHIQFYLLVFTLTLFAATAAVKAENPPSLDPVVAENGAAPENFPTPPATISLFDDVGRSSLCVDFSTGAFTWNILQGPGAGGVFFGTGKVLYLNGPWSVVYSTPTLAVSAVYDGTNLRAAAGMKFNGGSGSKVFSGVPITSALYESNTANISQGNCGGNPDYVQPQGQPKTAGGGILEGVGTVAESTPKAPAVDLLDDGERSEACFDFNSGAFSWNILTGPAAGGFYAGTGAAIYLNGPWSIVYSTPTMVMHGLYDGTFQRGFGILSVTGGVSGTVQRGHQITSTLYSSNAGVEARQPGCGGD